MLVFAQRYAHLGHDMAAFTQHVEQRCSVIRQGEDCHGPGDPYTWSATIRWIGEDSVEFLGVDSPMTPTVWREVQAELANQRITRFLIHRRRGDCESWRWIKVKKYPTDAATSAGSNSMTKKESPNVRDLERCGARLTD